MQVNFSTLEYEKKNNIVTNYDKYKILSFKDKINLFINIIKMDMKLTL